MTASEIANKIKEEATIVKERAETLVAMISVDQKEAESKLLAAKPALDAAEAALQVIQYHKCTLNILNNYSTDYQSCRYSNST